MMIMIVIPFLENHICLQLTSLASSKQPCLRKGEMGLRLNQRALHFQCLWSAHEFSTSANVLRSMYWKWNYLVCHFALSDMVKHRQGLSKLWGCDENFTTVMSVIHCIFKGKVYTALNHSCIPKGIKSWLFSIVLYQWLDVFLTGKI